MAVFLASKDPTEVVERRWTIPVGDDDNALSASLSASGVTVDADSIEGDELVLTLSAGTAAVTGLIVATITTQRGQTLVETLYIPVIVSTSAAETVLDVCRFALRKLYGLSGEPQANAAAHAVECLDDMLSEWRVTGADIGAVSPLETSTVLYCPRDVMAAVKNNLVVKIADVFELPISNEVMSRAIRGLQHIKSSQLSDKREAVYY